MIISANFSSAQTGVGYQFLGASSALIGTRVTTGISSAPRAGTYSADVTLPPGAIGYQWTCDDPDEIPVYYFAPSDLAAAPLDSVATQAASLAALNSYGGPTLAQLIAARDAIISRGDVAWTAGTGGGSGGTGLTPETIAALEAAEQILLASLYVPTAGPTVIIPAPAGPDLQTVYVSSVDGLGEVVTDLEIVIRILTPAPAVSTGGAGVARDPLMMVHDDSQPGLYTIQLEKGLKWEAANIRLFSSLRPQFDTGDDPVNLLDLP